MTSKTVNASVRASIANRSCAICFLRIRTGDKYLRLCVQRGKHTATLHYCLGHARQFSLTDPMVEAALDKAEAAKTAD